MLIVPVPTDSLTICLLIRPVESLTRTTRQPILVSLPRQRNLGKSLRLEAAFRDDGKMNSLVKPVLSDHDLSLDALVSESLQKRYQAHSCLKPCSLANNYAFVDPVCGGCRSCFCDVRLQADPDDPLCSFVSDSEMFGYYLEKLNEDAVKASLPPPFSRELKKDWLAKWTTPHQFAQRLGWTTTSMNFGGLAGLQIQLEGSRLIATISLTDICGAVEGGDLKARTKPDETRKEC